MARFNEIRFSRLDDHNFTGRSLDFFVRHQTVTECWRKTESDLKLVPILYEENWPLEQRREIAENVRLHMNLDQTGFGAFIDGRIVGFCDGFPSYIRRDGALCRTGMLSDFRGIPASGHRQEALLNDL